MQHSRYCFLSIFIFLFAFEACTNHTSNTKAVTEVSSYPKMIERAQKNKRYFIMQSGVNYYTVTSVDLDNGKQQMTVTLDRPDSLRLVHFKNPATRTTAPNQGSSAATHEIHIYMRDSTSYTLDEPHTIPIKNVARIELLD